MKAVNKEKEIDFTRYKIQEDGRIWSNSPNKKRELKGNIHPRGYVTVALTDIHGNHRSYLWHRVIWFYFNGEIPDDLQVNHIDENKQNNTLANLNLLTPKDNCNWGTRNERAARTQSKQRKGKGLGKDNPNWGNRWTDKQKKHLSDLKKEQHLINEKSAKSKKVYQYTLDGELVKIWPSTRECKRCGYNQGLVAECCRGGRYRNGKWTNLKSYKGYIWKYSSI